MCNSFLLISIMQKELFKWAKNNFFGGEFNYDEYGKK